MGLGHWEIILIVFIILLLFGGKKFPEFAKGLGKGLKEFKKSVKEPDPGEENPQVEAADRNKDD